MKMRSILAQYEYHRTILDYEKSGIPFRYHLYVPEVNQITKEKFHDREDEGHMLKVYTCHVVCVCVYCMSVNCVCGVSVMSVCVCVCVKKGANKGVSVYGISTTSVTFNLENGSEN